MSVRYMSAKQSILGLCSTYGMQEGTFPNKILFVSVTGGLALYLKNRLNRSQGSSGPLFYNCILITAIVLAGLDSVEQFVLAGLDSMEQFGKHFILPVSNVISEPSICDVGLYSHREQFTMT